MTLNRYFCSLLVAAACAAFISPGAMGDDWTLPRANPQLTNSTYEDLTLPLSLAWMYATEASPSNSTQPVVSGNTVVFATNTRVYALDTITGSQKWVYPSNQQLPGSIKGSLAVYQERLYFGATDGDMYQLSLADGRLLGVYPTQGPIVSSPVIADGRLYFGSGDNSLHCIDPISMEPFWLGGFRTRDDVSTIPAVGGGLVFFASRDTFVYAASAQTGKLFWSFRIPVPVLNLHLVVGSDTVYMAAGSQLYAMSARGGVQRWLLRFPAEIVAPPALADQTLYVALRNSKMYAITTQGKVKWEQPADTVYPARCEATVAGDSVVVAAEKGVISAFDTETGTLRWRYVVPPAVENNKTRFNHVSAPPVWANGALYVIPDDGTLRAFRPESPDGRPADVYSLTPSPGMQVSGSPPLKMSCKIVDEGSGIDPESIKLLLDGNEVEHKYEPDTGLISYSTPLTGTQTPLVDGRHVLTVQALDWKGNLLDYSWSFVVDNSLPKPRIATPKPAAPRTRTTGPSAPGSTGGRDTGGDRRDRSDWRDRRGDGRGDQGNYPMPPPPPAPPGGPGAPGGPPGPGGGPPAPEF